MNVLIKSRYVHYVSFATLACHVAFVGAVLFEFLCKHIFDGVYHIFQLGVPSIDDCPKIRNKKCVHGISNSHIAKVAYER